MIAVKTDIRTRIDGVWDYHGGKSKDEHFPLYAEEDEMDLIKFIEQQGRSGLHESLVGGKFRPFADLDIGVKFTDKKEFETKMLEAIYAGKQAMEKVFPDNSEIVMHNASKFPNKISCHYTAVGLYYTSPRMIKYLLEKSFDLKELHFDPQVYDNNRNMRMPLCSKPEETRPLKRFDCSKFGQELVPKWPEENLSDSLQYGLITAITDDEEMPAPDGYVEPVDHAKVTAEADTMMLNDEQKAAKLVEMRKLLNAIASKRADDRASWFKGVVAIRNIAVKCGMLAAFQALAHEFAKKSAKYDETATNEEYIKDSKYQWGFKTLKDWADEDTPGWNDSEFGIIAGPEFDIELIKEKIKRVSTVEQLGQFIDATVDYMNKYYTLINYSHPIVVKETFELNNGELTRKHTFVDVAGVKEYFLNKSMIYKLAGSKDGEFKIFHPFDCWRKHPRRNEKERCAFEPRILEDPKKYTDPRAYQLFDRLAIDRDDCKDAPELTHDSPWLFHIKKRWCNNDQKLYDYVLNKFALQIQKPWIKHKVALGAISDDGAGKGLVLQPIFKIIGLKYIGIANDADQVLGKFNALIIGKLIVFLDELTWGGDKKHEAALKRLITEMRTGLEKKGKDTEMVNNPSNVVAFSNDDWLFPMGPKGRRAQILKLLNDLAGIQNEVTKPIIDAIVNTNILSIAKFLYARDISNFDVEMVITTDEVRMQKILSMNETQRAFFQMVNSGIVNVGNRDRYISEGTFVKTAFYKSIGSEIKYSSEVKFWKAAKTIFPTIADSRPTILGARKNCVTFPTLETMRQQFRVMYNDEKWVFDEIDEIDGEASADLE